MKLNNYCDLDLTTEIEHFRFRFLYYLYLNNKLAYNVVKTVHI